MKTPVLAACILALSLLLPPGPVSAQSLPSTPASPLVPVAPTSPLVPSAPGTVTALPKAPPVETTPSTAAPPTGTPPHHLPHSPDRPGNQHQFLWIGPGSSGTGQEAPSAIVCTQAGVPIISADNAYEVQVDTSGGWPVIHFRQGIGGPQRRIGLNSPTLSCTTRLGETQGGFNEPTGLTNVYGVNTLTCFRGGRVIVQQRVSYLDWSWSFNMMTMNYHLRDGKETPSSASYDVTATACLAETAGEELVQITANLQ